MVSIASDVCLSVAFTAPIGDMMTGCFRSIYKSAEDTAASACIGRDDAFMICTQFQACEARRAFPCFDEPNLKASFGLEIETRSDLVVLSNMPQKQSCKTLTNDGLTRVIFEETPKMSTYVSFLT